MVPAVSVIERFHCTINGEGGKSLMPKNTSENKNVKDPPKSMVLVIYKIKRRSLKIATRSDIN